MDCDLGVEGIEGGFNVLSEFIKGFLRVGNGGVSHFIIPCFSIRGSSSSAHFVQGCHDLCGIRGVKSCIQGEVGLHGLDPLGGISVFAREVGREGGLQLCSV